jgi:hypothetical protein
MNELNHAQPLSNLPQLEVILVPCPEPCAASIVAVVTNPMTFETAEAFGNIAF